MSLPSNATPCTALCEAVVRKAQLAPIAPLWLALFPARLG